MARDLVVAALRDVETLKARLDTLLAIYDPRQTGASSAPLKKENGRLSELGVQRLRMMVDAGRTDTEIAGELDITSPAVRLHRAKYSEEKVAPKRRGR